MTDRELMQQALDALEEINKLSIGENAICLPAEIDGALDALRERLAQPDPVLAEREACAAMLEANAMACENPIYRSLLQANAQAIREMGQP